MAKQKNNPRSGNLRIIAGQWRGRRFPCPPGQEIRPTGDRVRETLFNWLTPVLAGARCLDLFSGTGALGLEALSRQAQSVVFVDSSTIAKIQLDDTLKVLECEAAQTIQNDVHRFLSGAPVKYDIVFMDPPYGKFDVSNLCTLVGQGWLADGGFVYVELARRAELPEFPAGWSVWREKTAGQVRFMLLHKVSLAADQSTGV